MNDVNISKVYLLSVPLENDYKNTLYFTDLASQHTYFNSKIVNSFDNFSYQRKDNKIRIPAHIDTLYNCNYVMYQNSYYSNKWFYAFIKDMVYVSAGVTEIEIETDVIQTWLFDYNIKASFVEREHVKDDTIGLHTVPENLETGEYVCQGAQNNDPGAFCFVVAATRDYVNNFRKVGGKIYNGIYSGCKYIAFWTTSDLSAMIEEFDEKGYAEDITSIFVIPTSLIGDREYDASVPYYEIPESVGATIVDSINIARPNTLNGYTPKNKKLLTFPFQYLLVDNACGNSAEYQYEHFKTPSICSFTTYGAICPGTSRILVPNAYKQDTGDSFNYGLSLGKFPICNWASDVYTNWLTQNSVNIATSVGSSALQILGGSALLASAPVTGGLTGIAGGGMIAGGITGIASQLTQVHEHTFSPNQAKGNLNCGDVITSDHRNYPTFYKMCIKEEYAKIIDGFFDMFGYKINQVKVPNKAHRSRYWYTKTIDVNIDGAIPMNDLQIIKNCYNNGITFWRNASEIQNYSLSNNIV